MNFRPRHAVMAAAVALTMCAAISCTYENSATITIPAAGPATPYPSTINVNCGPGSCPTNVVEVAVILNNLTHASADDLDVLLVGPLGQQVLLMSDAGGDAAASGATLTFRDSGATLPAAGGIATGTYKPTDYAPADAFPAPAPAPSPGPQYGLNLSVFNGQDPTGEWKLYVLDDEAGAAGQIAGGWTLVIGYDGDSDGTADEFDTCPVVANADQADTDGDGRGDACENVPAVRISEFRLRGPAGAEDEFIELSNAGDTPVIVEAENNDVVFGAIGPPIPTSGGWSIVASDGTVRCAIPLGTVIPARGHYLCANNTAVTGYSIGSYPAGSGGVASPDATYTADIPEGAGLALFATGLASNFRPNFRLDAVGYAGAPELYREGAGLPTGGPETTGTLQHSLYRDLRPGKPKDADDNVADFIKVATAPAADLRLGTPGPENLSSPTQRNATIKPTLIDTLCPGAAVVTIADGTSATACARERNLTPGPAAFSANGSLSIRRRWLNKTGQTVTRLRFRVVDVTTTGASAPPAGVADLRARSVQNQTVTCRNEAGAPHPCDNSTPSTTITGTQFELVSPQPAGGGWNSSLSVDEVNVTPIAPGGSIDLQFLLGVQQPGIFRFLVNVEAVTTASMFKASGDASRKGTRVRSDKQPSAEPLSRR